MSKTYFTEDHEWLRVDGNVATVGITKYAQEQLGDLVFVDLPATGKAVTKGGAAVVVESVKAAFDIYAPVSGKIAKVNSDLSKSPALVNQSPYEKGWLFKIEKTGSEDASLMNHQAYQTTLHEEH